MRKHKNYNIPGYLQHHFGQHLQILELLYIFSCSSSFWGYEPLGISVFLHSVVGWFLAPKKAWRQSWSDFLQDTPFSQKKKGISDSNRQHWPDPGMVLAAETGAWFCWMANASHPSSLSSSVQQLPDLLPCWAGAWNHTQIAAFNSSSSPSFPVASSGGKLPG